MNFTFFEVYEILVRRKKNLTQWRGTENLRRMSPKYWNGCTASKRTTHGNYTSDGEKGTRRQYSELGTEMYPPTKKRTREKGAKMRLGRTGTLQPAECRSRQIISLENWPHNAMAETFSRIHYVRRRCSEQASFYQQTSIDATSSLGVHPNRSQ